jgi:myo-inositol 2-dehydrogenase / D-chiro-inositol 1-dehydrogenase
MAVKSSYRIVQVGLGVRGLQWEKVIKETANAEIVAFVARSVERLRLTAVKIGRRGIPCYSDLETALEEQEADILLLVSPPEVHRAQAIIGFRHGLHVLSEKPLTEKIDEAVDVVRRAADANRLIGVSMNFRYLPTSQAIRQKLGSKELGEPGYSQFSYLRHRDGYRQDLNKYPLTMKQPMLLEQSIHHIDLMRYCFASEIEWVEADTWNPSWSTYEGDSCVSALLAFANGVHGNYLGTWTAGTSRFEFRWRIDCSEGTLIQQQQFEALTQSRFNKKLACSGPLFKPHVEPPQPVPLVDAAPFIDDSKLLLQSFLESIEKEKDFDTDGEDHVRSLAAVQACIESAERGRRVYMNDFYERYRIP